MENHKEHKIKHKKLPSSPKRNDMAKIPLTVMADWYLNQGYVYHGNMIRWMSKRLKIIKFRHLMSKCTKWNIKEARILERAITKFYGSPIDKVFYLNRKSKKSLGIACYNKDNSMRILVGSRGSTYKAPSLRPQVYKIRTELENNDKLYKAAMGGFFWLKDNVQINNPSKAGAFICGSPISGPMHWKTFHGTPLKELA